MTHLKAIIMILIALAIVIVVIQNNDAMNTTIQLRVNPVFFAERSTGKISLYQVVLVAFLLGVISTGVYGMVERFRLKRKIKMLSRELDDKDKELSSLRNLPITAHAVSPAQTDIP
jgi:RsiW-degrading membrane proteinase PrsW (M82 family)